MSIQGLLTNDGINQSIIAANNEGFFVKPLAFRVSEEIGPFVQTRDLASILPTWYSGLISSVSRIDNSTLQFNCNIPAGVVLDPKFTKEVYVIGEDEDNNEYLLAFSQPTTELVYDPEGELRIRLQVKINNLNVADLYEFKYTQATEIEDHNNDPNAHPAIQNAINKAGVYTTLAQNRFNGQNYDGFPTLASVVQNRDVVYFDTINQRYDQAIYDFTTKRFGVGFYDAVRDIVVGSGMLSFPHGFQPYTNLYLSPNLPGQVTTAAGPLKVGYALPDNKIFVQFEISSEVADINPDGDFIVNIIPPIIRELTLEDSNEVRWDVIVDEDGLLTTVPNSNREPDPLFRIPKADLSYAQLIVQTDGTLTVVSPPLTPAAVSEEFYYLEDPNGVAWKLTVTNDDILETVSYQNVFMVKSELANHFAVQQIDIERALTYTQVFNSTTLPNEPRDIDDLLPYCFYDTGSGVFPIFYDGDNWRYFSDNSLV